MPVPGKAETTAHLRELLEAGTIAPIIDTYPLEETPQALRHMMHDELQGKVIVVVTEPLRIRRAVEADLAAVRACLVQAFAPYEPAYTAGAFRDTVPTAEGMADRFREMTVLIAEAEDGTIVGTIAHEVGPLGAGHLRGMAVLPLALGTGVASQLLQSAERAMASEGCPRVTLDTTRPLQRAFRFYERHGYAATGRVTDFFGMALYEYAKIIG